MEYFNTFHQVSTCLKNSPSKYAYEVFIILQQKEEKVAISLHTHANEIQVVYFISRYESLEKEVESKKKSTPPFNLSKN